MFKNIWFTKYIAERYLFSLALNKGFHYYSFNSTQTLLYNWMLLLIIFLSYISHAHTFYGSEHISLFQIRIAKFYRVHSIYKEYLLLHE